MPPSSRNCTYLNFTASHDGIGLRPLEGILPQLEIESIVSTVQKFGGKLTFRKHFGKDIPYEINSTFYDALKGTTRGVDKLQSKRFIASQMIMIALAGIPAIYLNSFFSAKNDTYLANKTQNNRSINRSKWNIEDLETTLNDKNSLENFVFEYLLHALNIKKAICFSPKRYPIYTTTQSRFIWILAPKHRSKTISFCDYQFNF